MLTSFLICPHDHLIYCFCQLSPHFQTMDVINEEEEQFLKTLTHGKRLFEKTVKNMTDKVIPGELSGTDHRYNNSIQYSSTG